MNSYEKRLEKILNRYLENNSLEDFLEEFDITPQEVVELLFEEGMLDEHHLLSLTPTDI